MKSPLLRAFFTPHVQSRLRKRLARCTLDCGFKTSESPALRGFVGEGCPIRGTSLYLVLKSNGLHRPKIRLKKFGFSPKTIPANIAKKLPSQLPTQSVFQLLSQTAHVCFHRRKRVHTRLSEKDRTQGHTRRNRGIPSLVHSVVLCCRRYPFYSTTLLYTYISRFSVNPHHQAEGETQAKLPSLTLSPTVSHPVFQLLLQTAHVCLHSRKRVHTRLRQQDRTQRPTRRNRGLPDGAAITTLGAFHTVRKPCVAGYQNGKLCRFWVLAGGALEECRKPAEQRCAYARRCPEASRPRWAA